MKYSILILLFFNFFITLEFSAQASRANLYEGKEKFEDNVNAYISNTVPLVNGTSLEKIYDDVLILDIRELEEYNVSHLPKAQFLGSKNPDFSILENVNKQQKIVVYCSIGYRSEKMGEKLNKMGFENVFNLYGSIFAWVNENRLIIDNDGMPTKKVHTYNKRWSKWVMNSEYEKIY